MRQCLNFSFQKSVRTKTTEAEVLNKIYVLITNTLNVQISIENPHHTKNQEHLQLSEKGQSINANTVMTEILELSVKDF